MGHHTHHCGLDPQSRGATRDAGEQDNTNHPGPSFPRRRETTGWGGHATLSNYWLRPWRKLVLASRQYPQGGRGTPRHCGLDPQSRGVACGAGNNKPIQPTESTSPLMGEESKVRVTARKTPTLCHSEQSEESRRPVPSYWLQGSIHRVGCDADEQVQTNLRPLSLDGRGIKGEGEQDSPTTPSLRT